jgi:hypothetical protein
MSKIAWLIPFFCSLLLADDAQFERGKLGIQQRAGCFLVDYNFSETDALLPDYKRDNRVYDVNKNKTVKEWIFVDPISPTRFKLQHVLLANNLDGTRMEGSVMKHTGEDWEYNASHMYEYVGNYSWRATPLKDKPNTWVRRITSLDDGLRYQCAAAWDTKNHYPEWTCENNFAPIPGRETRDMKRSDYQALVRNTRLISYGGSWIEREWNTKVQQKDEAKTELAKEVGKIWYVRLPDSDCADAQAFVKPRLPFWRLVQAAWDQVLPTEGVLAEKGDAGSFQRYMATLKLEKEYLEKDLSDPAVRSEAEQKLVKLFMGSRKGQ